MLNGTTETIELTPLQQAEAELEADLKAEEALYQEAEPDGQTDDNADPNANSDETDDNADADKTDDDTDTTDDGQTDDTADPDKPQTDQTLEDKYNALVNEVQQLKSNAGRVDKLGKENQELKNQLTFYDNFANRLMQNPNNIDVIAEFAATGKLPQNQANQTGTPKFDMSSYDPNDPDSMAKFISARS